MTTRALAILTLTTIGIVALLGWWGFERAAQDSEAGAATRKETSAAFSSAPPAQASYPAPAVAAASETPSPVFRDRPGEETGEALRTVFPAPELPGLLNETAISESLSLLARNGSDLTRPMPSRHRVLAATPQVAAEISRWAAANRFSAGAPEEVVLHGGVKRYAVELQRTSVPAPAAIVSEGREVLAGTSAIPGAWYQTWQGSIVR